MHDPVAVDPAQQCLETGDFAGANVDFPLQRAVEGPGLQRIAQLALQQVLLHRFLPELAIEERNAAFGSHLGAIHGRVGMSPQGFGISAVHGMNGHADRGGGPSFRAFDTEGFAQAGPHPVDRGGDIAPSRDRIEHDHKPVAADPAKDVAAANRRADPYGHFLQKGLTHSMAVKVVDPLEVVQVDECQCQALVRLPTSNRLADQLLDIGSMMSRVPSLPSGPICCHRPSTSLPAALPDHHLPTTIAVRHAGRQPCLGNADSERLVSYHVGRYNTGLARKSRWSRPCRPNPPTKSPSMAGRYE